MRHGRNDPSETLVKSKLRLSPTPESQFVFDDLTVEYLQDGRLRVSGSYGSGVHVGQRRIDYAIDLARAAYTTRVLSLEAPSPAERLPAKMRRRVVSNLVGDPRQCTEKSVRSWTRDPEPPAEGLAATDNVLQWMYNTSTREIESLGYSDGCWANPETNLYTTWYVNGCWGEPPHVGTEILKPMTAEYINWDWLWDHESTHARHEIDINAYQTHSSVFFHTYHWGESYSVLSGTLDEWNRSIECPYDEQYEEADKSTSPLVLDVNGDGIHTTGRDAPVLFDIDGDGAVERIGWTNASTEEAFLWLDLDENHRVDGGRELFGTGTLMPSGHRASDGFAALSVYDAIENGGNNDGTITSADRIFWRLRLWIDRNHNGVADADREIATLPQHGVAELHLNYVRSGSRDRNGNVHALLGSYTRDVLLKTGRKQPTRHLMHDVYFIIAE